MRSRTAFLAALLLGLAMLLGLRMLVRLATGTPGQGTSRAPEAPLLPPVRVESSRFTVDGEPFRFIGANAIYFGLYPEYGFSVTETIKAARENGITVLRIYLWLGGGPWGGQTLEDYDAVLDAAAREGVYILAVLTDCCPGSDWAPTPEEYFRNVPHCNLTDPSGLTAFKEHIESILTRRNTVNGRIYRDDPTILGWDVANEPQLQHFEHEEVHRWLGEVVAHIKALDKNHLVTIGIVDSPAYDQPGPAYAALDVPGLDFHSYHYYTSGDWCASDAYVQAIRL
ncbi:MAG: cellulase family glycosylhydrolase, partial [Anaerolineae bacterium]|nr:cellulase family glycosylhydrolase [Anaerolineae bacterium]